MAASDTPGMLWLSAGLLVGLGPVLGAVGRAAPVEQRSMAMGLLFDRTGSYALVWQICIALSTMAALLNWPVREQAVMRLRAEERPA
ncbi:hypothetical protein D3C78_906730 [compost metagenome]|jgi:hypothetical protein